MWRYCEREGGVTRVSVPAESIPAQPFVKFDALGAGPAGAAGNRRAERRRWGSVWPRRVRPAPFALDPRVRARARTMSSAQSCAAGAARAAGALFPHPKLAGGRQGSKKDYSVTSAVAPNERARRRWHIVGVGLCSTGRQSRSPAPRRAPSASSLNSYTADGVSGRRCSAILVSLVRWASAKAHTCTHLCSTLAHSRF